MLNRTYFANQQFSFISLYFFELNRLKVTFVIKFLFCITICDGAVNYVFDTLQTSENVRIMVNLIKKVVRITTFYLNKGL